MYSICTACDNGFEGKLNELHACQLPGITCPEHVAPYLCEDDRCKYFFDEDWDYGCTTFILCDECLNSPEAIREMLKVYDQLFGY